MALMLEHDVQKGSVEGQRLTYCVKRSVQLDKVFAEGFAYQDASNLPTICWAPFIIYHKVTVAVCSSRLYHLETVSTAHGVLLPQNIHRRQNQESRLAHCFEDTQKRPQGQYAREVDRRSMQCEDAAPKADVQRQVFRNRHAFNDPVRGIFDYQYADIDTGRQPGEALVVLQAEIFLNAHNGSEAEGRVLKSVLGTCEYLGQGGTHFLYPRPARSRSRS
jgi:hypothetical protein